MNRLFIDDLRFPIDDNWTIVRTYCEAVLHFKQEGVPEFISFDHDLGAEEDGVELPTGYDVAKELVRGDMDGDWKIPDNFSFTVHSANPVGKKNIECYLNNYLETRKQM